MSRPSEELLGYLRLFELMGVRYLQARGGAPSAEPASRGLFGTKLPSEPAEPSLPTLPADGIPPRARETLEQIQADLGDCTRCKLSERRKTLVFGDGNPNAELVFVGEGPGADEDRQGLPFVGAAGKLLNRIIKAMNMEREDVYICNIVKCRPPGNRTPEEDEIRTCTPFVVRQIESIRPRVICALGLTAAQTLTDRHESLGRMRGQLRDVTVGSHRAKLMVTYHPAYLLRSPDRKKLVWEDVQQIMAYLGK